MIYLIKSLYLIDKEKGVSLDNIKLALKIGYTEDKNKTKRLSAYNTHNKAYTVIKTVPGGTLETEGILHAMFNRYSIEREWFEYREEILKFFENLNTVEDLDKLIISKASSLSSRDKEKLLKKFVNLDFISNLMCEKTSVVFTKTELASRYYKLCNSTDIVEIILKDYDIPIEKYNRLIELSNNLPETVRDFLAKFNQLPDFFNKMKYFCESELTPVEISIVLDQIPLTYKTYYNTLGPERLKANGYNITYITREFSMLKIDKEDLSNSIFTTFLVGSRYSKSDAKEKLRRIYENLDFTKTPKAADLLNYFEVKDCKVLNQETGKFDNGFEIIKRR